MSAVDRGGLTTADIEYLILAYESRLARKLDPTESRWFVLCLLEAAARAKGIPPRTV